MAISLGRRKGNWRNMVLEGLPEVYRNGPRLAEANYPEVLVARAVSDGAALEAVIHPGAGNRRVRLGLDQLIAGRSYRAVGAVDQAIVADPLGRADIVVDLEGRHELRILPA
jgi:hypothetical protein